jgi:hypothetical protein
MEIHWETSAGEVAIRGLRWMHPKKITFWGSLTPRILTEEAPISGIAPPPLSVSITDVEPVSATTPGPG